MLEKIREVFGKITGASVVDEKLVKEITRELQRALISSDVNISLVQQLSRDVEKAALKEELPPGISRKEHLVKLIYDKLIEILGGEEYKPRIEAHKILLVGLYGSGKTTTVGKLAKFYTKRGLRVCAICTDTWRPAAYEQVVQVGKAAAIPVFGNPKEKDALKLLKNAMKEAEGYEVVIVDSAGRDSLNTELVKEIRDLKKILQPEETFLVISSDIGQTAVKQAQQFNESAGLTGVIATKADASGKAGGALSACHVAKVPVAFIGTGEKIDDFEIFDAEKFVSRLLGFPDLGTLAKKMKEAAEEADFSPEDLMKGEYNLRAFYKQLEATKKMGSMKKIFEMLGMSTMPQEMVDTSEEKMKKYKVIMDSMSSKELDDPELINSQRMKRIAKGSGTAETEVRELIKQYEMSQKMIKKFKKGKVRNVQDLMKRFAGGGGMQGMGGGKGMKKIKI
ncbi:MAG: signal recognition particle receptor subunit alpha [Candidatus Micrarchaeota archaeon]